MFEMFYVLIDAFEILALIVIALITLTAVVFTIVMIRWLKVADFLYNDQIILEEDHSTPECLESDLNENGN